MSPKRFSKYHAGVRSVGHAIAQNLT